jgi:type III secretion protein Q
VAEIASYPFARWTRISRSEARAASDRARALAALESDSALADARTVLGAAVAIEAGAWSVEPASRSLAGLGESIALVLSDRGERAVITLAPGIARVVADRVVGGTGASVALGPTPLSRGEAGLVGYVIARAIQCARSSASLVDALGARAAIAPWGEEPLLTCAFTLTIGDQRGQGALCLPSRALRVLAPAPRVDPKLLVRASLVIGDARLPRSELVRLAAGDIVVPDTLSLDPRIADVGRARLVVGRSARAFELALSEGAWRVVRPIGLAAPRAPARWKPRKGASMSQSETDTLQSVADVEVEVSIELARLELPIGEVSALAPGVVLTTGRLVGERVAVRVADRVIAWGELVDVEGEVGVRVTEVAKRD